ncbi:MAG: hypothetical protein RJA20_2711, partial [Bacteroidota bacterium]
TPRNAEGYIIKRFHAVGVGLGEVSDLKFHNFIQVLFIVQCIAAFACGNLKTDQWRAIY